MFSSWWSKGSTGSFSCELGQEVKLNGLILGAGAFGQLHSGSQNKIQNNVSIFVASESMISSGSSAVKKLKTLRHPSVITFIDSHESDKAVLLATEPVEPLLMHLNKVSYSIYLVINYDQYTYIKCSFFQKILTFFFQYPPL